MKSRLLYYKIYQNIWGILYMIFPPTCSGCGIVGSNWCQKCQSAIRLLDKNICSICGKFINFPGRCVNCEIEEPPFVGLRSWAVYEEPLRSAIHRLKYKRDISLAERFSRYLIDLLTLQNWDIDIIVPVPLSIARHKERGYNQSSLLAIPIAIAKNLEYHSSALKRNRDTNSQIELTQDERWGNVRDAFWADRIIVENKNVLIIDDVVTSGATIHFCAIALINAGAANVYGMTLARTISKKYGGYYDS